LVGRKKDTAAKNKSRPQEARDMIARQRFSMPVETPKSEFPEVFRILANALAVALLVVIASIKIFDWQILIERDNIWKFSALAIAFLLPVAVFMSLKRAHYVNRDYRRDPKKSKEETRYALLVSAFTAGFCAIGAIALTPETQLGLNRIAFNILISVPSVVLIGAYILFDRVYDPIRQLTVRGSEGRDAPKHRAVGVALAGGMKKKPSTVSRTKKPSAVSHTKKHRSASARSKRRRT
jgi:hypothetical protein